MGNNLPSHSLSRLKPLQPALSSIQNWIRILYYNTKEMWFGNLTLCFLRRSPVGPNAASDLAPDPVPAAHELCSSIPRERVPGCPSNAGKGDYLQDFTFLFPPFKLMFPFTETRALVPCAPCSLGKGFVDPALWQKYGTFPVWARINIKQLT